MYSLCQFLRKHPNIDEVQSFNQQPTSHISEDCDIVDDSLIIKINNTQLNLYEIKRIDKTKHTLQKLILIANLNRKLIWALKNGEIEDLRQRHYWMLSVCLPVLQCVVNCCQMNLLTFQFRWGVTLKHLKFNQKCSGNPCGYSKFRVRTKKQKRIIRSFSDKQSFCQNSSPIDQNYFTRSSGPIHSNIPPTRISCFERILTLNEFVDCNVDNIVDYESLCLFL